MKNFKRIIKWTLIPIVIELVGLLCLNQFYFNGNTNFSIKKVDTSSTQAEHKIKVKIPEDAEQIKVSNSGNYISYYDGMALQVVDTVKNDVKEVNLENELSYYTWNLDTDTIFIAEKTSTGGNSSNLKFESYDAKRDEIYPLKNLEKNQELSILLPDDSYEVKDVAFSGASNVAYVMSCGNNYIDSRIYRIDVMIRMNLVDFIKCKLGNIGAVNGTNGDELIYEDRTSNRIRTGRGGIIATGENAMHYFLNTDEDNNIYIGNGENNKIDKIFVTNLKAGGKKVYTLPQYVNKNSIYVARDGKIYVDNPSSGEVKELTTGRVTKYNGKLLSIYEYGVISRDGNKVVNSLF
ncbi:MAG: hypothetical protein GXW91_02490 [Clostridiales bacterium]|nr:hypothetical protein [Clostridiales bacterium]